MATFLQGIFHLTQDTHGGTRRRVCQALNQLVEVNFQALLPHIDGVAGVVLDAPIEDLTAAAHRMMTFQRPGDRRSTLYMYEPWRSLIVAAIGAWSGFSMSDVRPIEVVPSMPHDLPVLVISEELDDRAPPDTVAELYRRMPQHDGTKELWSVPGVGHGKAFRDAPARYDEALGRLLSRLRR